METPLAVTSPSHPQPLTTPDLLPSPGFPLLEISYQCDHAYTDFLSGFFHLASCFLEACMNQDFVPLSSPAAGSPLHQRDRSQFHSLPLSRICVRLLELQAPLRAKGSAPGPQLVPGGCPEVGWWHSRQRACGIRVSQLAPAASAARGQPVSEELRF